jgi:hypothetical protein
VDFSRVEEIARAILHEGYLLYPYRSSSLKNCRPCAFGTLYPKAYSQANGDIEPSAMQIECLVCGDDTAALQGAVRFLQDVSEREVVLTERGLSALAGETRKIDFSFSGGERNALEGYVEMSAERVRQGIFKLRVRIHNETTNGGADHAMLSTHAVLGVCGGRFLSLIDPPAEFRDLAETCKNRGAWPVLAGDPALANLVLAAPIILYDYPQIAPETPGDLFDGTEIDEILTLRILTLADAEKDAMKADARAHALLKRTEALASDQLQLLHGTFRRQEETLKPGDSVVIRPRLRADVLDLALDGNAATIVSIEQDFEGHVFYTVAVDSDPGRDLGIAGKPGHRFFFRRDELELTRGEP